MAPICKYRWRQGAGPAYYDHHGYRNLGDDTEALRDREALKERDSQAVGHSPLDGEAGVAQCRWATGGPAAAAADAEVEAAAAEPDQARRKRTPEEEAERLQRTLFLGNLDAQRDWGHAAEYVRGMWMMVQQDQGDDFVLATGITTRVRTFVEWAFEDVGIALEWRGAGVEEKGYCKATGALRVAVDPRYFRPTEVELLIGDATKAKEKLGWVHETSPRDLAREMVQADLVLMRHAPIDKQG